ncbi:MAG: hypothetical protein AAGA56_04370 [Myxococcota bacterium]
MESSDREPARGPAPGEGLSPRLRRFILGMTAVSMVTSLLATAFTAYLLAYHPLALVGLNPKATNVVLVAHAVPLVALVAVAAPRRYLNMLLSYGLGMVYGRAATDWARARYRRLGRFIDWLEPRFDRWAAVLLLFVPTYSLAGLAGTVGTRFRLVALALIPGQVVWAVLAYTVGASLAQWIEPFVAYLKAHMLEATLVTVFAVALSQGVKRYRARRADKKTPGELPA